MSRTPTREGTLHEFQHCGVGAGFGLLNAALAI